MKIDWVPSAGGGREALRALGFLHLYFLALIGQHDCVTLLNGDPTVYPCVCRDESMAVFILIAVSEPAAISVIISVSAAIAAVFIIIVTAVISSVIFGIFVIVVPAAAPCYQPHYLRRRHRPPHRPLAILVPVIIH